jgi:hypothetical protein
MRAADCEVCAAGRAAMDAGNRIGRKGAASLVPVLEKMPQLTSLRLGGARTRFWARPRGLGGRVFGAWCWVCALMRCGVVEVRACGRAMRPTDCEVCAEGRAAMDAGNELGPEGAASLAPALEKMTQLTLLALYGARIRFWARSRGAGGVFCFGAWC